MSGSASISGLASGLDTATIIDQLMQLEAVPQTRLKSRVSTQESALRLLQNLNTRLAALATQAADLTDPAAWAPLTATSSNEGVTVAATAAAVPGSLSFTVDQTAVAHRLTFTTSAALTDVVVPADAGGAHPVTLTVAGVPQTVDAGNGTLADLVAALNGAGTGVAATTVKLDDGTHRLVVQSAMSGAAATVSLTAGDGTALLGGATVLDGRDAAITIGSDTVHSATNTFSDVLPGLEITVSSAAVGETVDLNVARDSDGAGEQAKSLIDAVNAALADIDVQTGYNVATKSSGALAGESAVRSVRTALLDAVYPADGTSLADIGIQTDRYGKLVLDEETFAEAYAADAAAVTAKLSGATGLAGRIEAAATAASDQYTGTLTQTITGRTTGIERLKDSIAAWDDRLELRRNTLTRQFTALEVALSQMNSQSSWLAGQINSLPSMNSGS